MEPGQSLFKDCNITVVAEGLYTSLLHANYFPELGTAQNTIQIPALAVLDFGSYSFQVDVEGRRVIARDATGQLSATSPIASITRKFIEATQNLAIKAMGFNFRFELVFQGPAVEYVLDGFLNRTRLSKFGEPVEGAGFKVLAKGEDHLLQVSVDPVWGNPLALAVLVNYHHDSSGDASWSATVEKYSRFAADAQEVIRRLLGA